MYVPDSYLHQNPVQHSVSFLSINEMSARKEKYQRTVEKLEKNFSFFALKGYLKEKYRNKVTGILLRLKRTITSLIPLRDHAVGYTGRNMTPDGGCWSECSDECILFGACLIFDKDFITDNDVLFEPHTFMYEEEFFLKLRCTLNNYRMAYYPDVQVWHTQEGSADFGQQSFSEYRKCRAGKYLQRIKAVDTYIDYLRSLGY